MSGLRTIRGTGVALRLPQTDWPPLQKAVATYDRLREEQNVTQRRVYDLTQELERSREKDRQTYAKAIAAGKDDPGTPAEDKTRGEHHDAQRRLEALGLAVENAERALVDVVDEHRENWTDEAGGEVEQARQEFANAVEAVAAAAEKLAERRGALRWLRKFPDEQASVRVVHPPVSKLLRPSGEPYFVHDVLDALRAVASPGGDSSEAKDRGLVVASRGGEPQGSIATEEISPGVAGQELGAGSSATPRVAP